MSKTGFDCVNNSNISTCTSNILQIFVYPPQKIIEEAISVNKDLAKAIKSQTTNNITVTAKQELTKLVNSMPDNVIIKDFELLFNPDIKLDILSILTQLRRQKTFSIIWNGSLKQGSLFFSEPDYEDYKEFRISNYQINIIQGNHNEIFGTTQL